MRGQLRRIATSEFAGQNLVLAALIIAGVFFLGIVIITSFTGLGLDLLRDAVSWAIVDNYGSSARTLLRMQADGAGGGGRRDRVERPRPPGMGGRSGRALKLPGTGRGDLGGLGG